MLLGPHLDSFFISGLYNRERYHKQIKQHVDLSIYVVDPDFLHNMTMLNHTHSISAVNSLLEYKNIVRKMHCKRCWNRKLPCKKNRIVGLNRLVKNVTNEWNVCIAKDHCCLSFFFLHHQPTSYKDSVYKIFKNMLIFSWIQIFYTFNTHP